MLSHGNVGGTIKEKSRKARGKEAPRCRTICECRGDREKEKMGVGLPSPAFFYWGGINPLRFRTGDGETRGDSKGVSICSS